MKNVTYINASAGSGKTYTLTHKLAELIEQKQVKPEQVIMTTFTVKAASEMKEEAKKVLYEKGLFEEASRLDQAMIGTIHSVANALIKKYWFFLGLSPDMGVLSEEDTDFYASQSLADLPGHDELRLLHSFCEDFDIQYVHGSGKSGNNYDFWKFDIQQVISFTTNYEIEDYERSIKESLDFIRQFVDNSVKSSYTKDELTAILKEYQLFVDGKGESDANNKRKKELRYLWRGVGSPSVGWYKRLSKLLKSLKGCPPLSSQMREELETLWHWPLVYEKQEAYIRLLFELARRWNQRYRDYKKEKNLLDYNDMEKYMRDLLTNETLAKEISMDYRYLFVDEYQDCSPIQVKIFDRLSELMERSYWVGDYKQAIYGFRGSDITLTKTVVDRIALEKDGCKMAEPLGTSYRSLPDIVKVCNETFKRTFKGILNENEITLKTYRENTEGIQSLQYWDLADVENVGLASHIASLVQQGVTPSDIAVLGRANAPLNELAKALAENFHIPASRENQPVMEMKATPLVMALLALVASEKDSLAKSQIALLTEQGCGTKEIIESKLLFDDDENNRQKDFLNDVPLVKRLLALRPMLKQQSVAAQVETMIIELDLYNEVKKIVGSAEGASCLNTIIRAAGTYEQHCVQLGMAATVSGFMDYLALANPVGTGDANGVQLHTYHSSKGLQWKYVILTSLKEHIDDRPKCVKKQVFGIHFRYTELPSAENPYPEVYISVVPFIYGAGLTKVPDEIESKIEQMPVFDMVFKNFVSENNRLMYVGMTRPQDVLILALEKPQKGCHELQWLEDIGLDCVKHDDKTDLLGVGCDFKDETLPDEKFDFKYASKGEKMHTRRIPYQQDLCEEGPKAITPSTIHEKGEVDAHYDICERMDTGSLVGKTMADVGDCIHQIYCGIESHIGDDNYYRQLIDSYGVKTYLTDAKAIRTAWEKLTAWLTEQFGAAVKVHHERPFTLLRDGHVLTGSIDLVWQTAEGDVLIDFKTCPMGKKTILDSDSDHYAGWYAGQLDAYTDALEAAGEKVLKRLIYYPVSGLVCEIGRANPDSDSDEMGVVMGVDEETVHLFKSGKATYLRTPITEDNCQDFLENIDGHLILTTDEMPDKFHGCYYWNKGVFPYAIKKNVKVLILKSEEDVCVLDILGYEISVGDRFRFENSLDSRKADENGDSCVWNILFHLRPITPPKTYLLRWNPAISSFKLEHYRQAIAERPDGFGFDWSINEWEEAHEGDHYYMLRTGDKKAGIVFHGVFTSEPYEGDDWAGQKGKTRRYMDMDCFDCVPADEQPPITIEVLEKAIPNVDWRKGHSGELLSDEDAEKLDELWNEYMME